MANNPTTAELVTLARSLLSCELQWSDTEAALVGRLAEALETAEPPLWKPLPGPQTVAYLSPADVVGYGGAAGGGKTDLGLGLAITAHRHSLIMRREACNLRAIIDRARDLLGNLGRFNGNAGVWRDLPGGRQLEFGGCKGPGDEQSYRGRPHELLIFDEADQFTEPMVRFIGGWLRTTIPGQRCRVLITFNPPSSRDGEWLLSYFAPWIDEQHPNPARPGELRWYAVVDRVEQERPDGTPFVHEGETITPKSRTFIPARLMDNPHLSATAYGATLQALPEPLRSQLLYGNFQVGRQDDAWQVIPTAWVKAAQERWRASPQPPAGQALSCLGVDVAYGGADSTCVAARYGSWFARVKKYQGAVTDSGLKASFLVLREHDGKAVIRVDVIGYGAACYEALREKVGRLAVAVNVAEAPQGYEGYDRSRLYKLTNRRTAMYWKLREALDPENGDNLALPPEPELLADLTAPCFEVRASGIVVEPKERLRERIGRSPDMGDAVCLAHLQTPKWEAPSSIPNPPQARPAPTTGYGPRYAEMRPASPNLYGGRGRR